MTPTTDPVPPPPLPLGPVERVAAVTAAAVFLGVGLWLVVAPPQVTRFAPQCAASTCVAQVSEVPDGVPLVAVAVAGLMVFIAVNGLRVSRFKAGGLEAETHPVTDQARKDLTRAGASVVTEPDAGSEPGAHTVTVDAFDDADLIPGDPPVGAVDADGQKLEILSPDAVPLRVLQDFAHSDQTPAIGAPSDVVYAARASGRGNHPWLIKLPDSLWKLTYGGRAKNEATIRRLDAT